MSFNAMQSVVFMVIEIPPTVPLSSRPVRKIELYTKVCTETPLEIQNYCTVFYVCWEVNDNVSTV